MTAHPLDGAVALEPAGPGRFTGRTSADYWNRVGPYGGITAAVLQRAVLDDPRRIGEPLALTVNYCAPVRDGGFAIDVEIPRSGRTTQHVRLTMRQTGRDGSDTVVALGLAVMGVRRPLWGEVVHPRPVAPPPDTLMRRPARDGIRWLERYDARYPQPLQTVPPVGGSIVNWVRDDPPRPLDFPSLAALADHFLPQIFARRPPPVPIATVSMNIYFHADAGALAAAGDDWLLARSRSLVFDGGFHDAEGELWHGERLLATTQQIVWYRE